MPLAIKNEQREQQIRQPSRIVSQQNVFHFSTRRQQLFKVFFITFCIRCKTIFQRHFNFEKEKCRFCIVPPANVEAWPTLEKLGREEGRQGEREGALWMRPGHLKHFKNKNSWGNCCLSNYSFRGAPHPLPSEAGEVSGTPHSVFKAM